MYPALHAKYPNRAGVIYLEMVDRIYPISYIPYMLPRDWANQGLHDR